MPGGRDEAFGKMAKYWVIGNCLWGGVKHSGIGNCLWGRVKHSGIKWLVGYQKLSPECFTPTGLKKLKDYWC
ncbi:MAG: hypothetical protein ACRC62_03240 [Microcoleus sp.]